MLKKCIIELMSHKVEANTLALKVSKSQNFIAQKTNKILEKIEPKLCQIFHSLFGQSSFKKNAIEIKCPLRSV